MRSTVKTLLLALAALLIALLPGTAPAWATDPVTIPSGTNIVDRVGALGARTGEVEEAIAELRSEHGVNLYIVMVDTFTNPGDRSAWAQRVAADKGMGTQDVLFAVATGGQYQLATSSQNRELSSKRSAVIQNAIVPNLTGGEPDFAQASIDTAKALGDAAGGGSGTVPSGADATPWIIGGGIVAAGAAGAYLLTRRRTPAGPRSGTVGRAPTGLDPLATMSVADLRQKANGLLVRADDAVRSSEQELGFAEAAYGAGAVAAFTQALAESKAHLAESFKLQQQLDDHIPDTEEQQRSWLGDIIRKSEASISSLAEQKADFDALRELERNAPAALETVDAGARDVRSRLASAEASLADLRSAYSGRTIEQVSDNAAQAAERLEFVDNASTTARERLGAGSTSEAAVAVRAAEQALQQARVLLDAIDKASAALGEARSELGSALAETRADTAQARAMADAGQNAELAGVVAGVETVVAEVEQALSAGTVDPIALLERIEKAHQQLDAALSGIRDRQEQAQRAEASLQHALATARAQIGAAEDYIAARRGGVGTEARTRLAEAQRNLDYAVSIAGTDPVTALAYAEQANALAAQAAQIAQNDVDSFAGWGRGGYGGGYPGMFGGRRDGGGIAGAVLGGIIINSILSGGHHHQGGGWGEGSWGGGGGFSGGWGGDGGGFGSGFGGGGDFGGDGGSF
ncbi:TPM domain-containing protein [Sinomonas halotolerans]|uniref:TPM domain-containing protein n=1 Tax=Sinomonas halotolerans TaxID=1644133 RepID=A0ABU9WWC6_9MICC